MDIVYNPNNEMNPLLWGPMMWNMLHIISFNYPIYPSNTWIKKIIIILF